MDKEITALWEKVLSLEKKLSNFTEVRTDEVKAIDGKAWTSDTLYTQGDTVIYNSSFARCLHTNKGVEPTNAVYWKLITVSDMVLELMERIEALEKGE